MSFSRGDINIRKVGHSTSMPLVEILFHQVDEKKHKTRGFGWVHHGILSAAGGVLES